MEYRLSNLEYSKIQNLNSNILMRLKGALNGQKF